MSTVNVGSNVRISYVEQGDPGGACVVLIPGPTDSWSSYGSVLDHLPPSVRGIAMSPRGHGDSDKPAAGYQVADFARDVVEFLDGLGIERAVLAGHSGSCLVVRRAALEWPERVAGLVLEASPTTLVGDTGLSDFVERVVRPLTDPIDPGFVRAFIEDTSSSTVDADTIDELVAEVLKVPAFVWHEMFAGVLSYDDLSELGGCTTPTLLIWGDADPIVPRAMQDDLAALMHAELRVYDGVGHTPRWEDPARFAEDVVELVERTLPLS